MPTTVDIPAWIVSLGEFWAVVTDDGYTLPFTKVEIKKDDTLYMELTTDSDVITISVKIEGDAFNGTASSYMGEAPIVGEKQTEKK